MVYLGLGGKKEQRGKKMWVTEDIYPTVFVQEIDKAVFKIWKSWFIFKLLADL